MYFRNSLLVMTYIYKKNMTMYTHTVPKLRGYNQLDFYISVYLHWFIVFFLPYCTKEIINRYC